LARFAFSQDLAHALQQKGGACGVPPRSNSNSMGFNRLHGNLAARPALLDANVSRPKHNFPGRKSQALSHGHVINILTDSKWVAQGAALRPGRNAELCSEQAFSPGWLSMAEGVALYLTAPL